MNQRLARHMKTLSLYGLSMSVIAATILSNTLPAADAPAAGPVPAAKATGAAEWAEFQKTVQPFFNQYCISCHGDTEPQGEVNLKDFADAASLEKKSHALFKAMDMVRTHRMPPQGEPQPPARESGVVVNWLDGYAMKLALAGGRTPGHVTTRRLNRSEYNNTIRDLLAIEYRPADAFPVDDAGYGFDNNGDVLSMAPMLMEKYLATAVSVLDRAIMVEPALPPPTKRWEAATIEGTIPTSDPVAHSGGFGFGANMLNGRVFHHRGEIYADYDFPESGTYILRVRAYGNQGYVDRKAPVVEFRIDGKLVDKPITISNDQRGTLVHPTQPIFLEAGKRRVTLAFINGPTAEEAAAATTQPAPQPVASNEGRGGGRRGRGDGNGGRGAAATAPGATAATAPGAVTRPAAQGPATGPAALAAVATMPAGTMPAGAAGLAAAGNARGAPPATTAAGRGRGGRGRGTGPQASPTGKPNLGVVFIEVEGPQEITMNRLDRMPESYRRVMITLPSATVSREQAARQIISNFATRAFRRPLRGNELERMMAFWAKVNEPGVSFDRTIALALQPVLASPNFLYRIEDGPAETDKDGIRTLNEYELASRLSYFLWSSMPDDELFQLAKEGKLRANLEDQVRRMIASPKSMALVEDFAGQWLQLRKMTDVAPDAKKFPAFDDALRAAMIKETQLFVSAVMREDRSVLEFIDADFTFMNETLAGHYGRSDIKGEAFQRVALKGDRRGGGLLTHASVLTITSYPHRTSPVIRGKWVLENLLDAAPPPPPPDVPALAEGEKTELTGTLRQRMEQHRSNPNCVSCHTMMDPIGFGLENFDAIGKWRDRDTGNAAIDASGELPGGKTFNGAAELKTILLAQKDEFCHCLANRMLTYALGRGVERSDLPMVKEIAAGLKSRDYRFSALVNQIVQSDAFQKQGPKRGEP